MDFAVAANFVGDETVEVEGEETVTCAKLSAEKTGSSKTNCRDLKLHTPGDRYVLVFCFLHPEHPIGIPALDV